MQNRKFRKNGIGSECWWEQKPHFRNTFQSLVACRWSWNCTVCCIRNLWPCSRFHHTWGKNVYLSVRARHN